jgi:aquaporin Z
MSKYLTEFIGTFFLVLTIGIAGSKAGAFAPIAIGSILMVMVYMGGHISGAQYNPAVSLGVLIAGKQGIVQFVGFAITQVAAAVVATLVVNFLAPSFAPGQTAEPFTVKPGKGVEYAHVIVAEILYTFALVLVVLNAAVAAKTKGNSFYGLAIGFTVAAGAFSVGAISGGAFNPAVGTGPNLVNGAREYIPAYLIGPFVGGLLAGDRVPHSGRGGQRLNRVRTETSR